MATASVTYSFVNSTTAQGPEVNQDFNDLVTFLNNSVVHVDGSKAMTGALSLPGNPTSALQATPKQYVDAQVQICTSATRPASPSTGMRIYETDTKDFRVWSGTAWLWYSFAGPAAFRATLAAAVSIPDNTTTYPTLAEIQDSQSNYAPSTFTAPVQGFYNLFGWIRMAATTTARVKLAVEVNGTARYTQTSPVGSPTNVTELMAGGLTTMGAGDTAKLFVYHIGSGAALNLDFAEFTGNYVRPYV